MRVDLELTEDGIDYDSRYGSGSGNWIKMGGEYIQVLVLPVDDRPLGDEMKKFVQVIIKTTNPLELA